MKSLCFAKRARNLVLFVWPSCYCRCQRERSDIKRDGWVSCFIICHFGKNSKEAIFRTWWLYFSHNPATIRKNPRLQHSPSDSVIISTHKAQFVTFYSLPWTITYQIVWSFSTVSHYSALFSSSKPIHSIELPMLKKTSAYVSRTITRNRNSCAGLHWRI